MATEEGRISKLEARMDGHENLCAERWTESRKAAERGEATMVKNHVETSERLKAIEDKILMAQGGAWMGKWIGRALWAGGGAVIIKYGSAIISSLPR